MRQKLIIEVETNVPLESYGANHMLVYDGTKKVYFPMTRKELLITQDNKIKQIHEELENFEKEIKKIVNDFTENVQKDVKNFKNNSNENYSNFLKTYKETNSKMIEMVKSVVVPQGV